jgi:hypothetical protein
MRGTSFGAIARRPHYTASGGKPFKRAAEIGMFAVSLAVSVWAIIALAPFILVAGAIMLPLGALTWGAILFRELRSRQAAKNMPGEPAPGEQEQPRMLA